MIDIENDVYLYENGRIDEYNKVLDWITKICRLDKDEIVIPCDISDINIWAVTYHLKRLFNISDSNKIGDERAKDEYVSVMKKVRCVCSHRADHDKIDFITPREILKTLQYVDRSGEYQEKMRELESVCKWDIGDVHKVYGINMDYIKSMIVLDTEIGELVIKSHGRYLRESAVSLLENPKIFRDDNFIYVILEDKHKYMLLTAIDSSIARMGS